MKYYWRSPQACTISCVPCASPVILEQAAGPGDTWGRTDHRWAGGRASLRLADMQPTPRSLKEPHWAELSHPSLPADPGEISPYCLCQLRVAICWYMARADWYRFLLLILSAPGLRQLLSLLGPHSTRNNNQKPITFAFCSFCFVFNTYRAGESLPCIQQSLSLHPFWLIFRRHTLSFTWGFWRLFLVEVLCSFSAIFPYCLGSPQIKDMVKKINK